MSHPQGTVAPPPSGAMQKLWVAAIALTAVASFALGVLLASGGIEVRFAGGDEASERSEPAQPPLQPATQPSAAPSPAASPVAAATADAAEPPADPNQAAAEPEPEEPAEPEPEDELPEADVEAEPEEPAADIGVDPASLPPTRGLLRVESSQEDAVVYVRGTQLVGVGETVEVDCGVHFLRLGSSPLVRWYSPGRAYNVVCQELTVVEIEPGPSESESPRPRSQFLSR